jgi:glycerate 2-kinase
MNHKVVFTDLDGTLFDADMASKDMLDIFHAALAAADPYNAVLQAIRVEQQTLHIAGATYAMEAFKRIIVVGAGKATARMAKAIETLLGSNIEQGLIVVKDGHMENLSIIEQLESSHPVPAAAGVAATRRIMQMLHTADADTLVICLLSGGASALLIAPAQGLSLQDKQETTRLLLNAGASITELNTVRKHLSLVKGGRLAQAAYPAKLLTLIVSDVIGDALEVIASGPTAADSSTFAQAWAVLEKYALQKKLPPAVVTYLLDGMAGRQPETVRQNNPCLDKTRNVIIASNKQALSAAAAKAAQLGFVTRIYSHTLQGEARVAARLLAQAARAELANIQANERHCLLCGGETTVTLRGQGKGGRNQEFALAFAMEISGIAGISLLSAGTDGTDGPTDASGAMVDSHTIAHARSLGMDAGSYLEDNDSYRFFQHYTAASGAHAHLKSGPTGTNVMDIQIVLLAK